MLSHTHTPSHLPPVSTSPPYLHQPAPVDEHRQLLKAGRAARVVPGQLHNFLIGTLVLVLAEITIFFPSLQPVLLMLLPNVSTMRFPQGCSLSLSFLLTLCPPHRLIPSPDPPSFSPGDHAQRFLFPVDVVSLLSKQSALICQRSRRRFIKIQQAPTKDARAPPHHRLHAPPPLGAEPVM